MNSLDISYNGDNKRFQEDSLVEFIQKVLHYLDIDNWELSFVFCSDSFIQELNSLYRGKNEATDVLSFPQGLERTGNKIYAGDIVISVDSVQANARQFDVAIDEELKRVIIHGILHLSGMDHETNDVEEPMLKKQESILYSLKGETIF